MTSAYGIRSTHVHRSAALPSEPAGSLHGGAARRARRDHHTATAIGQLPRPARAVRPHPRPQRSRLASGPRRGVGGVCWLPGARAMPSVVGRTPAATATARSHRRPRDQRRRHGECIVDDLDDRRARGNGVRIANQARCGPRGGAETFLRTNCGQKSDTKGDTKGTTGGTTIKTAGQSDNGANWRT